MNGRTFREACSERFGIRSDAFEEEVLWRCFHRRGLLLGKLLWRFNRACFDTDLDLIRSVADCTSLSDLRAELNAHRYQYPIFGFRRKLLYVRLSGTRLLKLGAKLFEPPAPGPGSDTRAPFEI